MSGPPPHPQAHLLQQHRLQGGIQPPPTFSRRQGLPKAGWYLHAAQEVAAAQLEHIQPIVLLLGAWSGERGRVRVGWRAPGGSATAHAATKAWLMWVVRG